MYMIFNNQHDAASQAFVDAYGQGYRIVNWYESESQDRLVCDLLGITNVSAFPTVVDTVTRMMVSTPANMDIAIKTLQGLDEEHIKQTRRDQINAKTESLITGGISYTVGAKTLQFSLNVEDQSNINGLFVNREYLTYPVQIKGKTADDKDDYVQLSGTVAVIAFYQAGFNHIQAKLADGLTLKNNLETMTYQQMLDFVDVR